VSRSITMPSRPCQFLSFLALLLSLDVFVEPWIQAVLNQPCV
jgi:hypothetical protein